LRYIDNMRDGPLDILKN